jgi:hypothetical protein
VLELNEKMEKLNLVQMADEILLLKEKQKLEILEKQLQSKILSMMKIKRKLLNKLKLIYKMALQM